jgi:hypothetical protein
MTTQNYGKGGAGIDGLRRLECRTAIQRGGRQVRWRHESLERKKKQARQLKNGTERK